MHLYFRQLVGFAFCAYATAYALRPDVGAIAATAVLFNTTAAALIALFIVCGAVMLLLPVHPPAVALLSLPLLLMAVSSGVRAAADPTLGASGVVAHAFTLMLIWRWAWRCAKAGDDD